jgi:hypothetical protein
MLKKFSFAGVSAGAIALATLCPLPSHALTFRFQFSDGINIGIGEIQGAETGQAFTDSNGTQLIYQAIGGFIDFSSGAQSYSGTYNFKDLSSYPADYNVFPPPEYSPAYNYPPSNISLYFWNNKFNNSYLWQYNYPGVVFASVDNAKAVGLWSSDGSSQTLSLYDSTTTNWTDYTLTTFSPSSPVPAPLPILGLGAATAFSRKLKQRIAVRRKREEEGDRT